MAPLLGIAAVAAIAWFTQGAAPVDRVVLLPEADGTTGRLVVKSAAGAATLDRAHAGARIGADGRIETRQEDAAEVGRRYADVLDARPPQARSFTVYFVSGSDSLTPESAATLAGLEAELARRAAPELNVIGHTDRVGTLEANDALSIRRAEAVRAILITRGVPAASIEATGRGEREPLVPTADEVAEPRNRRVEINLR